MPQKMIEASARAYLRATVRKRLGVDAADRRHRLGRAVLDALGERLEILGVRLDVLLVVRPSAMMTLSSADSSATSRPGLNCSMWVAWRFKRLAARVHDDEGLARASPRS